MLVTLSPKECIVLRAIFDSIAIDNYDLDSVLTELDVASKNTIHDQLIEFDFEEYDMRVICASIDVFIEGYLKTHPGPTPSVITLLEQIHAIIQNAFPFDSTNILSKKWVYSPKPPGYPKKPWPPFIE